jgi:hypothetical protein
MNPAKNTCIHPSDSSPQNFRLAKKGPRLMMSFVMSAAVAGCTMGWVRPGTSPDQVRKDNVECYDAAAASHPPIIVRAHSLPSGGPPLDEDANARLRDEDVKLCLRQKGYVFGRVP